MQNYTHKQVRTLLNKYLQTHTHASNAQLKLYCLNVKHYCKAFNIDAMEEADIFNIKYIVFAVLYANKQYLQEMEMQEDRLGECCGGSNGAMYITQDGKLLALGGFDDCVCGRYMQLNTMQECLQEVVNSIEMN